ncbi:hypothetical protein [Haloarcula salina]|uniref:DUF7984 domain-containing protein n=1 Tax=Haloarcula salina TaxID=1429914 RepID=A0AA41KEB5_9EURY|nr:hypothetical protein [Haloarcula salina]MBV0900702.1 hypothetical protein [Haloarcula salina]
MRVTQATVREEYEWVCGRADTVVPLVNDTRAHLGDLFGVDVDSLDDDEYRAAVDEVFANGDRAVNVAALVGLLRDLDVAGDYPGFVVDELLGRELAAMIAGDQPLRLLAEATFHVADVRTHGGEGDAAGADDLDAALAAGVQTRVPGWPWQAGESPFAVE